MSYPRKGIQNENGIVRIKKEQFSGFYQALNDVSRLTEIPVQHLYEGWLLRVLEGLTNAEIMEELIDVAEIQLKDK